MAAQVNRFITDNLKQKAIFEDGKNFNYLTNGLQLKHILSSEEDSYKVRDEATLIKTDKKMFKIPYEFNIRSDSSLLKIHFKKITTSNNLKLRSGTGQQMTFGTEQLKDGFKNYIMGPDSKVTITTQQGSQQVRHIGNSNYSCSYDSPKVDFQAKLMEKDAVVVQVACA